MHSNEHGEALTAYKSLHGPPVRETREAPLAASIFAVERVLRQPVGRSAHSGFVVTRPTENTYVCASIIEDDTVNAFADKYGNTYFATLHSAAAFCLFDLAAGLWSDRAFLPNHGDVNRLPLGYAPDYAVPRGLERLAKKPSIANRAPGWLNDLLMSACQVRLGAV